MGERFFYRVILCRCQDKCAGARTGVQEGNFHSWMYCTLLSCGHMCNVLNSSTIRAYSSMQAFNSLTGSSINHFKHPGSLDFHVLPLTQLNPNQLICLVLAYRNPFYFQLIIKRVSFRGEKHFCVINFSFNIGSRQIPNSSSIFPSSILYID